MPALIRSSHLVVTALLLALAIPAAGQIYRIETEDGVIFTDQPPVDVPEDAVEEVELSEMNTAVPPPAIPVYAPDPAPTSEKAPPPTVTITSPANETTIAMGPGDFSVTAQAQPALSRSETLLLLIDGTPWGAAQPGSSWQVRGALRGPHDLVVERRLGERRIARSDAVRVYVLRPSLQRR